MKPRISVGNTFGRLLVVARIENSPSGKSRWICQCACGNSVATLGESLSSGRTASCGCLRKETAERTGRANSDGAKHGWARTPEYAAWAAMKQRCTNPKDRFWSYYGGRGITVCPEWTRDFVAFIVYVGRRPSPKHTLDRIDNSGNYEPGNVRWATRVEQNSNRRHMGISCSLCGNRSHNRRTCPTRRRQGPPT